jgi:LDH2 family malate/lactate/ureidoglycolate dehydrogenase
VRSTTFAGSTHFSGGTALCDVGRYGFTPDRDENGARCAPRLGHFFIAIDTNHFMGEEVCRKKAGDIIRAVRASRKMPGAERIYTAGEKEYEIRQARRDGVPINDSVQAELNQLRRENGLEGKYRFPWD